MNDLKRAFRQLLKNPGFTAVAVLTLALGIGGSTAILSLINGVILRLLPFFEPARLVSASIQIGDSRPTQTSYRTYLDWREHHRAFEDLAIYDPASCLLTGGEEQERVGATRISANFFSVLRAVPLLGRTFTEEEANQRAAVVVVSPGFWQSRFAGDSNIVGRTIEISGQTTEIIGVMPEQFTFPDGDFGLWTLQAPQENTPRGAGPWFVLGRLKQGFSIDQAQAELHSVTARIAQTLPTSAVSHGGENWPHACPGVRAVAQDPQRSMELLVKSAGNPLELAEAVRREIRGIEKNVFVSGISTMEQRIGRSLFERRFQTSLLSAFSLMALLLSAIGTYAVMHFSVQQRVREIGVRMVLGAQKVDVLSIVLSQGLKTVLIGVSFGIVLVFALTRLMERLLYEIKPTDPLTFAGVSLLLVVIALPACWLPARRATKVDPMVALRYE